MRFRNRVFFFPGRFMKTVAIIPAGGSGRRMGGGAPKQYLPLGGVPILARTLQAFQVSPFIDEILLAVPEGDIPEVQKTLVAGYRLFKVSRVVAGGVRRQDSVRNALAHLRGEEGIVLVHDGVRPFVTGDLIRRTVAAAGTDRAVSVGIPVRESVKEVGPSGWVVKSVAREGLWLIQTPQAFHVELLYAAHERALVDGFQGTDDASLVERMGVPVRMIPGDRDNITVTTPEDLALGEMILLRFGQGGQEGMDADRLRI